MPIKAITLLLMFFLFLDCKYLISPSILPFSAWNGSLAGNIKCWRVKSGLRIMIGSHITKLQPFYLELARYNFDKGFCKIWMWLEKLPYPPCSKGNNPWYNVKEWFDRKSILRYCYVQSSIFMLYISAYFVS